MKGLAAVKVTSLIDAFNKPFLVGGLRRPEDTTGMGKEKGVEPTETRIDGPGAEELEPIGSPDWPDEPDEPPRSRGRGRTPSRSPGVSPEARGGGDGDGEGLPGAAAWRDPLEDGEDDGQPVAKRARVGG